jgi:copper chaperone CopZ
MQTEVLRVRSLTGESSADKVSSALKSIPGVRGVIVSVAGGSATVEFDEEQTSPQELQTTLARAGYAISKVSLDGSCGGGCCGGCGGK